ncbi:hypothetical protein [Streptomyces albiflavescens]|uniref:hypothetical protein n=1 Tax=Streptomyces albiflavescens TaxID=1623582 RepID=UPI00166E30D4|nr:hypothetical protein [Streptomyces albiflavescens]
MGPRAFERSSRRFKDPSPGDTTWVFDASSLACLGTKKTALLEVGLTDRLGRPPVR